MDEIAVVIEQSLELDREKVQAGVVDVEDFF